MFEKLIITATLCLIFASCAQAESISISETLKDVPLRQGIVYSLRDSEISHLSTAVLAEKWNFGLEAGYMDSGKLVGAVSYRLLDLKNYVTLPIIKELSFRPGIYVATDEIDTGSPKLDYGVSLTVLSLSW